MSLKSIATYSADWNNYDNMGLIRLRRADGAKYRVSMTDLKKFDEVVADLARGGPIHFDTKALTITVRNRRTYRAKPGPLPLKGTQLFDDTPKKQRHNVHRAR